jgi:5'-nucleotidase
MAATGGDMRILLTNDDGIQAVGIRDFYAALVAAGHEVQVVAPISEQSAVGHAITIALPLRVKEFAENGFRGLGVSGTPADCVKLALTTLLPQPPDVVVSGINAGPNVGVDILYSGTVSAATEGALMGYPAVAVSAEDFAPTDMSDQGRYAAEFLSGRPWEAAPPRCVLNLNFPNRPVRDCLGLVLCAPTPAVYDDWYVTRQDPRGRNYYWLTGVIPPGTLSPDSDRALLTEGHITLSPLRFDFTDRDTMARLAKRLGNGTVVATTR